MYFNIVFTYINVTIACAFERLSGHEHALEADLAKSRAELPRVVDIGIGIGDFDEDELIGHASTLAGGCDT